MGADNHASIRSDLLSVHNVNHIHDRQKKSEFQKSEFEIQMSDSSCAFVVYIWSRTDITVIKNRFYVYYYYCFPYRFSLFVIFCETNIWFNVEKKVFFKKIAIFVKPV